MGRIAKLLRFWATLEAPVNRRTYCLHGFSLAGIKYLGDVIFFWLSTGRFWKPTDYLPLAHSLLLTNLQGVPSWLLPALGVWTLPFLWIGVTLTLRRALDAGRSPWLALGFFLPFVNYAVMAAFCFLPTGERGASPKKTTMPRGKRLPNALLSAGCGVVLGLLMVLLGVRFAEQYGFTLFLGAPFAMGALTAFIFNRGYAGTALETIQVTICMFIVVAGALFLLAFEGAICIAMAILLGLIVGLLGAALGRAIALFGRRAIPPVVSAMLLLPLSLAVEPSRLTGRVLHEVRSSVVIGAPPERVWSHVIAFKPISEAPDLVFRLGIADPRYARIDGVGVGAIRYCVFSTGEFVEPITEWETARRLGFSVVSSPAPLRELSLYQNVSPPHLRNYLRPRRGEFRLVALPGGRTRLEGSTWYEIEMAPEGYWQLWTDFLIHQIHDRVLNHIKHEVEADS
jgi:uncharacterized membrane protein YhaH (DUF805 family)